MGLPKINVSSLQCPLCAGLTKYIGNRADTPADAQTLSFECENCGSFEVLAVTDDVQDLAADTLVARPGTELQDLWA